MWCSDPCVVIGRNQLAWLETNPREVEGRGWRLARRMSGGGAVFHDPGNLNVSFVESRKTMDRRKCMEFLQKSLMSKWPNLKILVGPRFDLWLLPDGVDVESNNKMIPTNAVKFSGAASRFSARVGLHHCTLLFDANLTRLSSILEPAIPEIRTKASISVRSPVANLGVPGEELREGLLECSKAWLTDEANPQSEVITVNAGEESIWLDGDAFEAAYAQLRSWDWIYGNSPKFSIPMETENGACLRLDCEKGRVAALVEEKPAAGTSTPLFQRISQAVTGRPQIDPWLEKLNDAIKGKPLTFAAIHGALVAFQMTCNPEDDPPDPYDHQSMVIDRLRALATCF